MAQRKQRELTEEEEDKLRQMYTNAQNRSKKFQRVGQWETFDGFKAWMLPNDWDEGKRVMRRDRNKPRTPENCYVAVPGERISSQEWEEDFCLRWNKSVNVLRTAAGLKPLEE